MCYEIRRGLRQTFQVVIYKRFSKIENSIQNSILENSLLELPGGNYFWNLDLPHRKSHVQEVRLISFFLQYFNLK
jgi:hypothetical protein